MTKRQKKETLAYKPLVKIKAAMVEHGTNQEEMAKLLNISTATFNRKLNGLAEFKLTELKKIAEILDIQESGYSEYFFAS